MKDYHVEATKSTPAIHFSREQNTLEIRGESYPENTAAFYAPFVEWLEEYLESPEDRPLTVNMELVYFNSSSSKILMDFFDNLEGAVKQGRKVVVNWIYDIDNDSALEYGEDFKEDLEILPFNLVSKT